MQTYKFIILPNPIPTKSLAAARKTKNQANINRLCNCQARTTQNQAQINRLSYCQERGTETTSISPFF